MAVEGSGDDCATANSGCGTRIIQCVDIAVVSLSSVEYDWTVAGRGEDHPAMGFDPEWSPWRKLMTPLPETLIVLLSLAEAVADHIHSRRRCRMVLSDDDEWCYRPVSYEAAGL